MDSTTAQPSSVSSPNDRQQPPTQTLLTGLVDLVTAEDRAAAARALASALGCRELLVFVKDAELDVMLPAPGFPQTLPNGRRWQSLLHECVPGSIRRSWQTWPGAPEPEEVTAATAEDGSTFVAACSDPDVASLDLAVLLLPLLSAAFRSEQAARVARVRADVAEHDARNAEALADALDRTRKDLQSALIEADEALRVRDDFLSIASHELKTPLTSLSLQVQMTERMARRVSDSSPLGRQVQKQIDPMIRSLRRLVTLADDLLDVSRISAGHLDIRRESVDLSEIAREVIERFADESSEREPKITLHAPHAVLGHWDPSRLDQVFTNLLTNALAYGGNKPIAVRLADDPEWARIEVEDHGTGIALEDQERIFARYERARIEDDGRGLGLGLHICSEIVHAHGGHIEVESQPGAGATFIVVLPRL